jgi:type IV secretory pathway VirB9-like protein
MIRAALVLILLSATPALAADPTLKPKPVEPGSPICTVDYDPNKPVAVVAHIGEQVNFQFAAGETIEAGFATDTANLKREGTPDLLSFKAVANSGPQSIVFRTHTAEGTEHTYPVLWTTLPGSPQERETKVASNGPMLAATGKPATEPHYCLIVRWTYSAEERAKKVAAARQQYRQAQARRAEAALQHAAPPTVQNKNYSLRGDARLIPQVTQ